MPAKPPAAHNTLSRLLHLATKFRDARDWKQFHTPKELAISLVVESGELLELMQWKSGDALTQTLRAKRQEIADELGDVLHSLLLLSDELNIDLEKAFKQKLRKLNKKYPIQKSKGRPVKYTDL